MEYVSLNFILGHLKFLWHILVDFGMRFKLECSSSDTFLYLINGDIMNQSYCL